MLEKSKRLITFDARKMIWDQICAGIELVINALPQFFCKFVITF